MAGYIQQGGRGGDLASIIPNYKQAAGNPWGLADYGTDNNVTIGGQTYSLRQDANDGSYTLSDTSNNDVGGYRYDANGQFQNWVPYNNQGNNDWVVPVLSAITMGAYGAVGAGATAAGDTGAAAGGGFGAVGGGAEGYAGLDAASASTLGGGASINGGAALGAAGGGAGAAAGAAGGGGGSGGAGGAAGGSGGAGSSGFPSIGSGPGGSMTTADYIKYGQMAGGALGAMGGSGGGGGGGGGSGNQYVPTGLGMADSYWQQGATGSMGAAQRGAGAESGFAQSYARSNGLDWSGYLNRAGQAGNAYGQVGDAAMGQMDAYGMQAQGAAGAESQMYGAAGKIMDTAFDPQNALYARTAQQTQDQIRAGQAARGLGNSEVGMMEEAGAMGNFNIDWQNAQLGRQATGIQAAGGAVGAGVGAGRLVGADMSAGLAAGAAGAGYYGEAGSVPMGMQQQWAGAPGAAAGAYVAGQGSQQQLWGNAQSGSIPYMNFGNGAIQGNYSNAYQQNRDRTAAMSQIGGAVAPAAANWFGSSGSGWSPNVSSGSSDWAVGGGGYSAYTPTDYGQYI